MNEQKEDFVGQLGFLSMAARMKRLSDHIMHSARQFYKEEGIDIEPNWYLVFLLLKEHECLSITEIAEALQFSHPSVITMVRKMHKNGYLRCTTDPADTRRQLVKLSPKAKDSLPQLETMWQAAYQSVRKLFNEDESFLNMLDLLHQHYKEEDFKTRTQKELNHARKNT